MAAEERWKRAILIIGDGKERISANRLLPTPAVLTRAHRYRLCP
jgi:hypothetical protein